MRSVLFKNTGKIFLTCFTAWFCFLNIAIHGMHTCGDGAYTSSLDSCCSYSHQHGANHNANHALAKMETEHHRSSGQVHHGVCLACLYLSANQSPAGSPPPSLIYHIAALVSSSPYLEIIVSSDKHLPSLAHAPPVFLI